MTLTRRDLEVSRRAVVKGGLAAIPLAGAAETVTGQEETSTPTPEPTTEPGESVTIQIDKITRIESWQYEDGKFKITLNSKHLNRLKITDSGAIMKAWEEGDGASSTHIPNRTYDSEKGRTTVTYDPVTFDEAAAVTLASADGMVFLRTDSINVSKPAVPWEKVQLLLAGTFGATAFGTYNVAKKKADAEDKEAERLL